MGLRCEDHPCWWATCDRCGEGDNEECGTSYHYPSQEEAEANLREMDWEQTRGGSWFCGNCYAVVTGEAVA